MTARDATARGAAGPEAAPAEPRPFSNAGAPAEAAPRTEPKPADHTPQPVPSKPEAEPAPSSATSSGEAPPTGAPIEEKATPAVKTPASGEVGGAKAADVLHAAKNVRLTTPKGARFIRVTDAKGRQSVEPIENVTKGANVFHQAGPFQKVEAGVLNAKQQFVPVRGDTIATDASGPAAEAGSALPPGSQYAESIHPGNHPADEEHSLPGKFPQELVAPMKRPETGYDARQALMRYATVRKQRLAEVNKRLHEEGLTVEEMAKLFAEQREFSKANLDDTRGIIARENIPRRMKIMNQLPDPTNKTAPIPQDPMPPELADRVQKGKALVEAYVHPDLLTDVSIHLSKKENSYANGTDNFLRPDARFTTVMHEMLHTIESTHPEIKAACLEFRNKRTKGNVLKRLSSIDGNPQHADIWVYEDEWVKKGGSAYTGRHYGLGRPTEILSTGIERLHQDPLRFAEEDPEFFTFVVNTINRW